MLQPVQPLEGQSHTGQAPASRTSAVARAMRLRLSTAVVAIAAGLSFTLVTACAASNSTASSISEAATAATSATADAASGADATQATSASGQNTARYYYLGVSEGYVAIFVDNAAIPVQITELPAANLDRETAARIDEHPRFDSFEDARSWVTERRQQVTSTSDQQTPAPDTQATAQDAPTQAEERAAAADSKLGRFWGVWIGASKDEAVAKEIRDGARSAGFSAYVYLTTDWANLNDEPWYVITVGPYNSEDEAEAALPAVRDAGYGDAYVKFSGERQAAEYNPFS